MRSVFIKILIQWVLTVGALFALWSIVLLFEHLFHTHIPLIDTSASKISLSFSLLSAIIGTGLIWQIIEWNTSAKEKLMNEFRQNSHYFIDTITEWLKNIDEATFTINSYKVDPLTLHKTELKSILNESILIQLSKNTDILYISKLVFRYINFLIGKEKYIISENLQIQTQNDLLSLSNPHFFYMYYLYFLLSSQNIDRSLAEKLFADYKHFYEHFIFQKNTNIGTFEK